MVCHIKRDANNVFEKYKARIVVKGYAQEAGLDFDKTFAPIVRIESVCAILAIAAANNLFILHVDLGLFNLANTATRCICNLSLIKFSG